jgi:hypothetical protein
MVILFATTLAPSFPFSSILSVIEELRYMMLAFRLRLAARNAKHNLKGENKTAPVDFWMLAITTAGEDWRSLAALLGGARFDPASTKRAYLEPIARLRHDSRQRNRARETGIIEGVN